MDGLDSSNQPQNYCIALCMCLAFLALLLVISYIIILSTTSKEGLQILILQVIYIIPSASVLYGLVWCCILRQRRYKNNADKDIHDENDRSD